jgi:hypothetical protein
MVVGYLLDLSALSRRRPTKALQSDYHLGRFAPSVGRPLNGKVVGRMEP